MMLSTKELNAVFVVAVPEGKCIQQEVANVRLGQSRRCIRMTSVFPPESRH
jgi:hypothetical protein